MSKKIAAELGDCYRNGGTLFYLGEKCRLVICSSDKRSVEKFNSEIILSSRNLLDAQDIKFIINRWYLKQAQSVFSEHLREMVKRFDSMKTPRLRIRRTKRQWGSYKDHVVTLNLHLIKASIECVDYIILHELCHTYEKNHQKKFYELLSLKLKNWREIDTKLKIFAKQIVFD